jgi:hypothetical protein
MGAISEVLQEFVAFGCDAIGWAMEEAAARTANSSLGESEGTFRAVAIAFFRSILDQLDGIAVLVASGSGDQAVVLLRSTLESVMRFEYLLADDSIRRTYAVLTCRLHDKLRFLELLDPSTDAGREFLQLRREDVLIPFEESSPHGDIAASDVASTRSQLGATSPAELVEARAEYERLRAGSRRAPLWYNFWNGPASVFGLARAVRMGAVYRILYREASRVVHGDAAVDRLSVSRPGHLGVSQLRHPESISYATTVAGSVGLRSIGKFLENFCPSRLRDLGQFYSQVRPAWRAASSPDLLRVQDDRHDEQGGVPSD